MLTLLTSDLTGFEELHLFTFGGFGPAADELKEQATCENVPLAYAPHYLLKGWVDGVGPSPILAIPLRSRSLKCIEDSLAILGACEDR